MITSSHFLTLLSSAVLGLLTTCSKQQKKEPSVSESAAKDEQRETHELTWSRWAATSPKEEIEVFLDGQSMGFNQQGSGQLENLKFRPDTLIHINLPVDTFTKTEYIPFICYTHMFQLWTEDGAEFEFFHNGKKLDWHTLYFRNLRRGEKKLNPSSLGYFNSDTAIWYLDGTRYFDGPTVVAAMKKQKFDQNTTILVLFPEDYRENTLPGTDDSEFDAYTDNLADAGVSFMSIGRLGHWSRPAN